MTRKACLGLAAIAVLSLAGVAAGRTPDAAWRLEGGTLSDTRSADGETIINVGNAGQLHTLWSINLKGASRATPVSDGDFLFVPTSLGDVNKIDRRTGAIAWTVDLGAVLGVPGAATKGVALTDGALVFGLQNKPIIAALDKATGALLWKTAIDDHPMAVISQTPTIIGERLFIGVSGLNEEAAPVVDPTYHCCSFRGSVASLDSRTGKIMWKTHTIPEGMAGGSVWSRTMAIDAKRNTLYVTTGNLYWATPAIKQCADKNKGDPAALDACYPPGVWNDSILAVDLDSGAIKWGFRADSYDIYNGACILRDEKPGACPGGGDFDFANGAMLWHSGSAENGVDLVGAGQKSGVFWALNADTGKVAWKRRVGPGGYMGGIEHGSAVDGKRVYTALADSKSPHNDAKLYTLPNGQTINYGSFAALDAATGQVVWQTPDPAGVRFPGNDNHCEMDSPPDDCVGAFPRAPVSVADGVMFGCSGAPTGAMYAFDAATGMLLWQFESGAKCASAPAIIDGTVYWMGGRTLHAFSATAKELVQAVLPAAVGRSGPTVWNGVFTAAQAEHGRAVYLGNCAASCHLPDLAGTGPSPGLSGESFLSRWDGLSVGDLLKVIRATMPKISPGKLSNDDYLAVTSFLLSSIGAPAGQEPLKDDPATLDRIVIVRK